MPVFKHPEDYAGAIGCLGLLIALPVIFFAGSFRSPLSLALLGAFLALFVLAVWMSSKRPDAPAREKGAEGRRPFRDERLIRDRLKPGARFKAHGSMGTPMEGICLRIIDDRTIEARVGYADQPGVREHGPFPIANIDEVEE